MGRAMVGFLPFDMSSKALPNLPRSHLDDPDPLKQSLRPSTLKSAAEAAGARAKRLRQSAAIVMVVFIGFLLGLSASSGAVVGHPEAMSGGTSSKITPGRLFPV